MNTIKKIKIFLPFITIFFLISVNTYASVGRVIALRNASWAFNQNKKRDLKIKSDIVKKDIIETSKRARLQVMFNDDTIASLGPSSTMIVNDFEWDQKKGKFSAEAKEGIFRIMGGHIVKNSPENFNIKTPVASIGIRGSMFAFRVTATKMSIVFLGGKGIDVTTNFGKVALVKPGFGTNVSKELKKVETPRKFTIKEINNLLKDTSPPEKKKENQGQSSSKDKDKNKKDKTGSDKEKKDQSEKKQAKDDKSQKNAPEKADQADQKRDTKKEDSNTANKKIAAVEKRIESQKTSLATVEKKIIQNVINAAETPEEAKTIIQTIVNQASTDKGQEDIKTVIEETVAEKNSSTDNTTDQGTDQNTDQNTNPDTTTDTRVTLGSGTHTDTLMGINPEQNSSFFIREGSTSAELLNGELVVTTIDKSANKVAENNFGKFPDPVSDNATEYTGKTESAVDYSIDINGNSKTFASKLYTSNLNQFYVLNTPAYPFDSNNTNAIYSQTSFFGIKTPASLIPSSGFTQYKGVATGAAELTADSNIYIMGMSGEFSMGVNWANKRFMGAAYDKSDSTNSSSNTNSGAPTFFFGTFDNSGSISDFKLISSNPTTPPDPSPSYWPNVTTVYGGTAAGNIYGTKLQGLGISATGDMIDIKNGSDIGDASITMGGFKNDVNLIPTPVSSSSQWNGFVTGIGEDISLPSQNRKYFMNVYPEELTINLDRTNGFISGTLFAAEPKYPGESIDLTIGGDSSNSVYLDEKIFMGMLSGSVKGTSGSTPPTSLIEGKSSYLVTEKAFSPISDYVTWGYWEAAYNDPEDTSKTYHIHVPASMWVAGELTPFEYISTLMTNSQTLTYNGATYSVSSVDGGQMSSLVDGSINMTVDFGQNLIAGSIIPDSANTAFSMDFDGYVNSSQNGLNGYFKNDTTGSLNGAFFGPNANTAAGNFEATNSSTRYTGIFIGNKN